MIDYAKLSRRRFEERASAKMIRHIKWLIKKNLPPDVLLYLIVLAVFPTQALLLIKK